QSARLREVPSDRKRATSRACRTRSNTPTRDRSDPAAFVRSVPCAARLQRHNRSSSFPLSFGFRLAQLAFKSVKAIGPETLIEAQPLVGLRQAIGVEAAKMLPPLHGPAHQAGALERLHVLGGAGERHA